MTDPATLAQTIREELKREALHDDPADWGSDARAAWDAVDELLRLLADRKDALDMLRRAWNAHMDTCPQHAALPTPAEVQAWLDQT